MAGFGKEYTMSSDSEGPGSFLPPPRISARFSKTTTSAARRKSSAASSRRNSMSSHHSSKSALSAHGGPQSTHIAQHLRRASLLESRKARLAEKAAHAEKVRLRAAMAKAAPRVNANSEERALAAKQAREKYLAQVAANCHEEVKRAKRIAEDAREKKAADLLRMKGEMEERLAEAERRRTVFQQSQRRLKNPSLPPVEEKRAVLSVWKPRNENEATMYLQRAWRNKQRRRLFSELVDHGLTTEAVGSASFDDVGALLAQERVIECTSRLFKLYGLQESEPNSRSEKAAVRTFLSAFLITSHPQQVFSKDGVQEQDLISQARLLLESFETLLSTPLSHPGFSSMSPPLASFSEVYSSYQSAFSAWKGQDSSILVDTMVAQFVELDSIWQSVKNDTAGGVADDYKEGIQQNQTLIMVRLKRLVGSEEAMKMIREAVKEARRTKARKRRTKPVSTSTPRAAASNESFVDPMPSQSSNAQTDPLTQSWEPQAAAESEALTTLPDNRTIIHELAIDREYRIDLKPRTEAKEQLIRALSESMRLGLEIDSNGAWIVAMAQAIRKKLLALVAPGKSLHNMISETLDPGMIAQQVEMGAFSYQQFFAFINALLPQLCAPVRDAEVKALTEDTTEDLLERLARVHFVIDLLSLDHANFTLQMNAPMLLEQAAAYEQRCFSERYGSLQPPRTSEWWSRAASKTIEESSRRTGDSAASPLTRITRERIYMQGLVDTAIAVNPLTSESVPETLELDLQRLTSMRSSILRMLTIASILLTAKKLLKRDIRSQWKAEAARMSALPYTAPGPFLAAIPHTLPPATKTLLASTTERILAEARAAEVNHPVTKVLLQKLKAHVLGRLTAASSEERIRATTTASEALASGGLIEFVGQIGGMVDELRKVADVDREAHGRWYDEIAAAASSSTTTAT
ncbi:MAG: hypothetical protein Q9191_006658 [Dirinaria sp. TL-2023a]